MTRELRDSGVGWLGDTPAAWSVVPARALFGERKQKSSAIDVHLTPSQKYGVLPQAEYMEITGNKVVLNLSGADNMRHVEAGDYVSHLRSFQGGLEFAGIPGKVSAAYTVLKPKVALEPRFFKYLFKSDLYVQALQTTTDQLRDGQSIRYGQFTLIPLPYPELDEQRAIADYLDRETAQIDEFIAKSEELITLLTERRGAAIARTITGRRSGEADDQDPDWTLGLPSGWKLLPVKLLAKRVTDGAHISPETEGGEYDFVSTRDVSGGSIDFEGSLKTSPQTYSYMVRNGCQPRIGDVLYSKDGTIGETAVVRESRDFVVASSLIIITPDPSLVVSDYLRYALSSVPLLEQAKTLVRGAGLPRISIANLATVRVPLPTLEVQRELVGWLDQVTRSIDSAIGVARRSADLARERRAALISAAVTGKIGVGVAA